MAKGIVYILTNPCLDGWVKIGMTNRNDMKERLNQLNTPPNIPLSYRVYALYRVDNPVEVEKDIHELIDLIDDSLHARETLASGRVREREFFQISPEKAFSIVRKVAKLRGDLNNLELVEASQEEKEEEQIIKRRSRFTFKMLGIPVGSELIFIKDDAEVCTVLDDNNSVDYKGEVTTLSALARRLLSWDPKSTVQGPLYFSYNGEILSDRRKRLEENQEI